MINHTNRFHGRGSIRRLYSGGSTVRSGLLALRYAPNPRREKYRLGVVVSRKVSKSAVVRNRIRRRLYECIRLKSGAFTTTYDLLITVYDARVATLPPPELDRDVAQLLQKARITSAKTGSHGIVKP